jgi:hypothetical protein
MTQAIYCFDTASVRFAIHPEGPEGERCIVEIAEDPLRDLFGARGGGDSLVHAYLMNADLINVLALARHRETGGRPVRLETADFETSDAGACY